MAGLRTLQKSLIALMLTIGFLFSASSVLAALPPATTQETPAAATSSLTLRERLQARANQAPKNQKASLIFDLPLTYNQKVSHWIKYYQTRGKTWFSQWLEKSTRYMPVIQKELKGVGLPQDLAYMVMIESGFDSGAQSHANAVGPWQFIQPTGERYGLHVNWWLDERRDLIKSTRAAIRYIKDLHEEFGSWYLVAASYNMGEAGLRRQINKFKSRDFWTLAHKRALPQETIDYVPKILAAMLIAKSPALYGFTDFARLDPYEYELVVLPGGADLGELADHLGITRKALKDMNSELFLGYIPRQIEKHPVRIPRGGLNLASEFIAKQNRVFGYSFDSKLGAGQAKN